MFDTKLMLVLAMAFTWLFWAWPQNRSAAPSNTRHSAHRPSNRSVLVQNGALRWSDTGSEVALFGVNYYAAFSLDYHAIQQLGGDHRAEIDRDIEHLARLGLDLLRMHVFDREISDAEGNLIANEHLDLCDYAVHKCKAAGIYVLLTPIAWWPTPNSAGGFSSRHSIRQMTSEPEALAAQMRYLTQFMAHVNPYTGLAYAADPAIVAVEPINEPVYPAGLTDAAVTGYINALAHAIRRSGRRKPILYNGWEGRHRAVRYADVDGCTFNWYPTGLVNGHSLLWNVLPTLDRHPDMHDTVLDGKVKAIYEFDPADVPTSCLYPAMARSFRAGGAQLAAQFQYDPVLTAGQNLSWQTHHLNLCYTPAKAVSLMIAAEAFRLLPRGRPWGTYPKSRRFGVFEVSFERSLSLMNAPDRYFHSASTDRRPRNIAALRHVAGCGSSPLVRYDGSGAYFLDRVRPGLWRLEVYPDAVPANDPYGRPYIGREVARLVHCHRRMEIRVPDLGPGFRVLADGGDVLSFPRDGAFQVRPGAYVLVRDGVRPTRSEIRAEARIPAGDDTANAWHQLPRQWTAGRPMPVVVSVVGPDGPLRIDLICRPKVARRTISRRMKAVGACRYAATVPGGLVSEGVLRYEIKVSSGSGVRSYPSGLSWGEGLREAELFTISSGDRLAPTTNMHPDSEPRALAVRGPNGGMALRIKTSGPISRRSARYRGDADTWVGQGFPTSSPQPVRTGMGVEVCLRSAVETTAVQVGLSEPDGTSFAADVPVTSNWREVVIPLHEFRSVDRRGSGRTIRTIGGVWFSLLARLTRTDTPQSVDIAWAKLRPASSMWEVPVVRPSAPIPLFVASRDPVWTGNPVSHTSGSVSGMDGRAPAFRIAARDLGLVVGFRRDCYDAARPRLGDIDRMQHLRVRARWHEPRTCPVQVALIEQDGTPWGADVPITGDWRDVCVSLASFRYLKEWHAGPPGRGGVGDRPRLRSLSAVNVCFGAWLNPERVSEPHTLDIEEVSLE